MEYCIWDMVSAVLDRIWLRVVLMEYVRIKIRLVLLLGLGYGLGLGGRPEDTCEVVLKTRVREDGDVVQRRVCLG